MPEEFAGVVADAVHNRGSARIARAIEGLDHYHTPGVANITPSQGVHTSDRHVDDRRFIAEESGEGLRAGEENDGDQAEIDHVVEAGAVDGLFGSFGLLAPGSGRPAWRQHCTSPTTAGSQR